MTTYLGRLVDRAVGPPAAGVAPRLAPVFPLGRAGAPEPEPLPAETPPQRPVTQPARPAPPTRKVVPPLGEAPESRDTVAPSPALTEPREIHVEHRPPELPPERDGPTEAPAAEPSRAEIRTHERSLERTLVRREAEQAEAVKPPPVIAAPRLERRPVPVARGDRPSAPEAPRIEVRIGRVEVRRPPTSDPVEWPAPPVAAPPAPGRGFGELAAARRYVDRSWS